MTREEEITNAALEEFYPYNQEDENRDGFIIGAKWADQHPRKGLVDIDKACEWLNEHTVLSEKWIIEDFRKEMMEE